MPLFTDLTGKVFGSWTVLRRSEVIDRSDVLWECSCACGAKRLVRGSPLRHGRSTRCKSCHIAKNIKKHGESGDKATTEYRIWKGIIQRCCSQNYHAYPLYGGRGIAVCDRWRTSFEAFLEDVGRRPSRNHSLDRINNNSGYEPGNVMWSTSSEQSRNRRSTKMVILDGEVLCQKDAARKAGVSVYIISQLRRMSKPEADLRELLTKRS